MTPPPLPPGVEGHPVCPDIHTGYDEPDRDGWVDDTPVADRRALAVAVTGIRKLATYYSEADKTYGCVVVDLKVLLDRIETTGGMTVLRSCEQRRGRQDHCDHFYNKAAPCCRCGNPPGHDQPSHGQETES